MSDKTNYSPIYTTTVPDNIPDKKDDIPVPPSDDIDSPKPIEDPPDELPVPTRPDRAPVRDPGPAGPKKIV